MRTILSLVIALSLGASFTSCKNRNKQQAENIPNTLVSAEQTDFSGNYVSGDYLKRAEGYDWVAVQVNQLSDSLVKVSVRSRADKKRPTCTYDAIAGKIDQGLYKASIDGNGVMFQFNADSVKIFPEPDNQYANLNYFCSGGASIEGKYFKLKEPIDITQIDRVIFRKYLNYDRYSFEIELFDKTLTVHPVGLSVQKETLTKNIEGSVTGAETGDLNTDGFPEVLIYLQSDGSGSYGSIIGYSVNNGKSMSLINLPDIMGDEKASAGYMGHDEFRIVESTLVRRFPIYKPGDINVRPTGGTRQIQYKLKEGEAARQLVADKIVEY